MKGEEVKLKLKKAGVSITEIASLLGMSRQSLSQALSVKDVKTGLLEPKLALELLVGRI